MDEINPKNIKRPWRKELLLRTPIIKRRRAREGKKAPAPDKSPEREYGENIPKATGEQPKSRQHIPAKKGGEAKLKAILRNTISIF
ncbi:MAG: hypothetical protein ACE5FU_00520 [Nitrospinota bacterium]